MGKIVPAIRGIARILFRVARALPNPEKDPDLELFLSYLRSRTGVDPLSLPPEAWEEGLLDLIAERIESGWDRYGAPTAARRPEGGYVASAETPDGPLVVEAETKREAYRVARREWVRRLLG